MKINIIWEHDSLSTRLLLVLHLHAEIYMLAYWKKAYFVFRCISWRHALKHRIEIPCIYFTIPWFSSDVVTFNIICMLYNLYYRLHNVQMKNGDPSVLSGYLHFSEDKKNWDAQWFALQTNVLFAFKSKTVGLGMTPSL